MIFQQSPPSRVDTVFDTVTVVQQQMARSVDDSAYIRLLERTNAQLGLWANPYEVMVAVLSVLFTILTIAAAYLLYRQSKEHKEQIAGFLTSAQDVLNSMVAQANAQTEAALAELRIKLETATGEQKTAIEQEIAKLQQHQLQSQGGAARVSGGGTIKSTGFADYTLDAYRIPMGRPISPTTVHPVVCIQCRRAFDVDRLLNHSMPPGFVECPYCERAQPLTK